MVFVCPYCGEEFEDRLGRDVCVASHFSGEKKLPKPSRNRYRYVNILREMRRDVKS